MEAGLMDAAPVWTDLKTFPWESFRDRVDILTGGYPCQPFSAAGKRAGKDDPRHLWPWIADGIAAMRPKLCFFENVEGHISLGLSSVISDLEEMGYKVSWGIFSAAECGAVHQRKRVWVMAHRKGEGLERYNRLLTGCSKSRWQSQESEGQTHGCSDGGDLWPSRPGQPQYTWEPPRVVANSASQRANSGQQLCKQECGQGRALPCELDEPSQSVGNAALLDGTGQAAGQRPAQVGGTSATQHGRQTESTLGLCSDEPSGILGETLTLSPYVANVGAYENLSEKARARQILFEVWSKANAQKVQWTDGGLQCFLAEEILRTGMQLAGFTQRICYFVWCVQTSHPIQSWGLSGMWVYESCGNSSQGQEPIEQFKRELGYALFQLSYEIALERGQEAVEGTSILQGLREAGERAWALSNALPEMEEVWRSALHQKVWENWCYVEAASQGNRTDELRLLGNGVVPATAALAFQTLWHELSKD
jgi:site-specific DNA-cytosine methylase